jgi:hypothetical protein
VWYDWIPGCAGGITTKNKLMKRTVVKRVPTYKWVVEDLCDGCERNCVGAAVPINVEIPPPPLADTPLKFVRLDSHSAAP